MIEPVEHVQAGRLEQRLRLERAGQIDQVERIGVAVGQQWPAADLQRSGAGKPLARQGSPAGLRRNLGRLVDRRPGRLARGGLGRVGGAARCCQNQQDQPRKAQAHEPGRGLQPSLELRPHDAEHGYFWNRPLSAPRKLPRADERSPSNPALISLTTFSSPVRPLFCLYL